MSLAKVLAAVGLAYSSSFYTGLQLFEYNFFPYILVTIISIGICAGILGGD